MNAMAKLLTKENAMNWKKFVADFVVLMTAKKDNRELIRLYQVKKSGSGYTILVSGKDCGYGTMDAETLYSWMERLPLRYFAQQADDIRFELCS